MQGQNIKPTKNTSVASEEGKRKIREEYINFLGKVKELRNQQQEVINKYKRAIKNILD